MPVTYTVIDCEGFQHQRTHRDHTATVHRFAVVREPRNRDEIQFFGSEHLARNALTSARQRKWAAGRLRGKPMFPKAAVYPVSAVVE